MKQWFRLKSALAGDDLHDKLASQSDRQINPQQQEQFRRQVREYVNNGWDLVMDDDDQVIVKNRDIGHLAVHGGLLFLTMGAANLGYFFWNYTVTEETRLLRAVTTNSAEPVEEDVIPTPVRSKWRVVTRSILLFGIGLGFMLTAIPAQPAFGLGKLQFILLLAVVGAVTGFALEQSRETPP